MYKILVVDDDSGLRLSVKSTLESTQKVEVEEAFDGLNAVEKVKQNKYNAVLLDVDMPRMSGLEALKAIKEHDPSMIVIIMTAYATIDDAVQAVRDGAYNYVAKPVKGDELIEMVEKAIVAHNLISDVAASAPILHESGRKIIGNTAQMQKVFNIISQVAPTNTNIFISGKSGTGKELVAKEIYKKLNVHNRAQLVGKVYRQ